jgi:hypothetical protein
MRFASSLQSQLSRTEICSLVAANYNFPHLFLFPGETVKSEIVVCPIQGRLGMNFIFWKNKIGLAPLLLSLFRTEKLK